MRRELSEKSDEMEKSQTVPQVFIQYNTVYFIPELSLYKLYNFSHDMPSIQNADPADEGTRKMSRKFSEIQFPGLGTEASPVKIVPCSKDVVLEEKESRHSNSSTWNKVGKVKVHKLAKIYPIF